MALHTMDTEFLPIAHGIATEIVNDETLSPIAFSLFREVDIEGVDKVVLSLEDFALDSATTIDIYPQIADKNNNYRYMINSAGNVLVFNISGTTRKARQIPPFEVRGMKLRALVGSTGIAGNETIKLEIMRFRNDA
jgi:hypothetical protein